MKKKKKKKKNFGPFFHLGQGKKKVPPPGPGKCPKKTPRWGGFFFGRIFPPPGWGGPPKIPKTRPRFPQKKLSFFRSKKTPGGFFLGSGRKVFKPARGKIPGFFFFFFFPKRPLTKYPPRDPGRKPPPDKPGFGGKKKKKTNFGKKKRN